jgi:hypothetical protein
MGRRERCRRSEGEGSTPCGARSRKCAPPGRDRCPWVSIRSKLNHGSGELDERIFEAIASVVLLSAVGHPPSNFNTAGHKDTALVNTSSACPVFSLRTSTAHVVPPIRDVMKGPSAEFFYSNIFERRFPRRKLLAGAKKRNGYVDGTCVSESGRDSRERFSGGFAGFRRGRGIRDWCRGELRGAESHGRL